MPQRTRFFDSIAGDRIYSADAWAEIFSTVFSDGVFPSVGDELAVSETTPADMTVLVATGAAMVQGRYFEVYTSEETVTLDASSGSPRIDRIVVRVDLDERTAVLAVRKGTPAGSPTAPALVRTSTTYE